VGYGNPCKHGLVVLNCGREARPAGFLLGIMLLDSRSCTSGSLPWSEGGALSASEPFEHLFGEVLALQRRLGHERRPFTLLLCSQLLEYLADCCAGCCLVLAQVDGVRLDGTCSAVFWVCSKLAGITCCLGVAD
jgi:hypothetical protein